MAEERKITVIPATINPLTRRPSISSGKRRTAGYARVSTDKDEQFTSYEAQVDYYTNYIKSHSEWEFVKVYTDEGLTGLNITHRDGFNEMVEDALNGKIDLIITKSVSRFARNTVDSLTTIRKLKAKGVEVYFEKDNIWSFDGKGELILTIMSSLAQEESRNISENVTWGKRKKFEDGKVYLPYKCFLGYEKGASKDDPPVVNPEQAKLVRRIYSLFMNGQTPFGIARLLTSEGIPSPGGKEKWPASTIISILTNEKYKGAARLQKKFTVDFLTKKMKINEGEVPQFFIDDSHEAIIAPEEWEAVQDELKRRKALGKAYSSKNILSSKIYCGDCGDLYGLKTWHSTDRYKKVVMLCNSKYKEGKPKCTTPSLTEADVKERFVKVYNEIFESRDSIISICRSVKNKYTDTIEFDRELAVLHDEIEVLKEMVQKCISENAATPQDQEEYNLRYNSYIERYEQLSSRFDELTVLKEEKLAKRRSIERFIANLSKQEDILTEFDNWLWLSTVENVTVKSDGTLVFKFFYGAEIEG